MVSAGLSATLAGCVVGPDYAPPAAPLASGYTKEPLRDTVAAGRRTGAQTFDSGGEVAGQWWKVYRSAPLDRLVEEAVANNPSLEAAQASLEAAQEQVEAQEGTLYPSLTGDGLASYRKDPNGGLQSVLNNQNRYTYALYTPRVAISFAPDIFGKDRRQIESLAAKAEGKRFDLEAAYLTLTTNVVLAAIEEAALRGEIAATNKVISAQADVLNLYTKELALGEIPRAEMVQQQANLSVSQLRLPPLEKRLAVQRNLLTALAGRLPSAEVEQSFTLAALRLPAKLPVSLPSQLVERRPDVRVADALVHQASADLGVAIANRLPQFMISSNDGSTAITLAQLATTGPFYSIIGTASQPLFDAGTLYHKKRAAEDVLMEQQARYKQVVLSAFQNVADALRALQIDGKAVAAAAAAEKATSASFELVRKERVLGVTNSVQVFVAEQTYLAALVTASQTRANQYADTAALFQALGGGWWNRDDVKAPRPDGDFFKFL